ncbi:MAG: sialate O-acetylesterase, partial [Bacteroidaceae bacterium]|nr:sialate O-acetylesterase [Bacteroidaceae bacterium]
SIACDGPEDDHHTIDGNKLEVFFKHAEDGLSPWNDATGFEIAGADGKFYPAKAKLVESNKSFILTSDAVPAPKQVRYCFKNFQIGNVINHRNLPLVPFRSDK